MHKSIHSPSLVQDIGALAGLYRTVFRMMGRKIQYGQVWPDEVYKSPRRTSTVDAEVEVRARELVGSK